MASAGSTIRNSSSNLGVEVIDLIEDSSDDNFDDTSVDNGVGVGVKQEDVEDLSRHHHDHENVQAVTTNSSSSGSTTTISKQSWACHACTFHNSTMDAVVCAVCNTPRASQQQHTSNAEWSCLQCTFRNKLKFSRCQVCQEGRRPIASTTTDAVLTAASTTTSKKQASCAKRGKRCFKEEQDDDDDDDDDDAEVNYESESEEAQRMMSSPRKRRHYKRYKQEDDDEKEQDSSSASSSYSAVAVTPSSSPAASLPTRTRRPTFKNDDDDDEVSVDDGDDSDFDPSEDDNEDERLGSSSSPTLERLKRAENRAKKEGKAVKSCNVGSATVKQEEEEEEEEEEAKIEVKTEELRDSSDSHTDYDNDGDGVKEEETKAQNVASNAVKQEEDGDFDDDEEDRKPSANIKMEEQDAVLSSHIKEEDESSTLPTTTPAPIAVASAVRVKTEKDWLKHVAKTHRKYGDRVLLARQSKQGIMKLGGGNCRMGLYPGEKNKDHPRFDVIGDKMAIWYNDNWQPYGPKYAGDPSAAVDTVFGIYDQPISVFMKRGQLGTEYCGDYQFAQDQEVDTHRKASDIKDEDKRKMRCDILDSLSKPDGVWIQSIKHWKEKLSQALEEDESPADLNNYSSLAARARAVGYHKDMPLSDIASQVVLELNEFYVDKVIKFVEYDEVLYEYIKEGETTRNAKGKKRKKGEACAKASDWYSILDMRV